MPTNVAAKVHLLITWLFSNIVGMRYRREVCGVWTVTGNETERIEKSNLEKLFIKLDATSNYCHGYGLDQENLSAKRTRKKEDLK